MKRFLLLMSFLSIAFFGCKVSVDETAVIPTAVSEIKFNTVEFNLNKNEEKILTVVATDKRKLNDLEWTTSPEENSSIKITVDGSDSSKAKIKGLKKGTVTVKVTEKSTGKNASIKVNVKEPTAVSDILFKDSNAKNMNIGDSINLEVITKNNRELKEISWSVSEPEKKNCINIESSENGKATIKAIDSGILSIIATEKDTNKKATISISIKDPVVQNKYKLQIGEKGNTSNLIPSYIELKEDIFIDIRAFDNYSNNQSIGYVTVKGLPEDVDHTLITTDKQSYSYYATIHADRLDVGREVQVYFVAGIGMDEVYSDFYTIKRIEKESKPEEKPSPETKPDSGSGGVVGPSIKNPVYNTISYNTGSDLKLKKKETKIIEHNFEKEKVYWLGGIDAPKPEDFQDYKSTGQIEYEYDEFGNKIKDSGVASNKTVPKYYVHDKEKTNPAGKNWYNVNKSMAEDAPDSAMCWAMASAGALHWWFDSLGEDYTDKLFYIRKNRKDMKSPTTKSIFDDFHADDIHYKPLSKEGGVEDIKGRSGIASYAIKSFANKGGNPRDLFRLYFLSEDDNNSLFKENPNYKKERSLGLLNGMDWIATSGVNRKDGNDERLWEYVSLVDHSRNTIVNEFKRAINENCAIVLEQGNIRDDATSADSGTMKSAHAIIVWGVIFDESEQNLVGLYVGDNNLKDGNLARVDLVYKQISDTGGRYYYAAPYMDQNSKNYLKSTSIYAIDKLYPPTDTIRKWINTEAEKLNYTEASKPNYTEK